MSPPHPQAAALVITAVAVKEARDACDVPVPLPLCTNMA
jgi:hypothetical protein